MPAPDWQMLEGESRFTISVDLHKLQLMKNLSFQKRFGFALNGIKSALKAEASFRTQTFAALAAVIFLIVCKAAPVWWALICLSIGAVLTAELLNTALEHLLDRLHPEVHESIRLAKDCAAGAVLIASFVSLAVMAAFLIQNFSGQ